jgi:hypothetical protein
MKTIYQNIQITFTVIAKAIITGQDWSVGSNIDMAQGNYKFRKR